VPRNLYGGAKLSLPNAFQWRGESLGKGKGLSKTKGLRRHLNLFFMENDPIEMASEIHTINAKSFPMSQPERKRKSPGRHVCGKVAWFLLKAHKYL